jgi:hypothetical protein
MTFLERRFLGLIVASVDSNSQNVIQNIKYTREKSTKISKKNWSGIGMKHKF